MNSPFTAIADEIQGEVINRWLGAKLIENAPCGWDLIWHDDEWRIYTLGRVKELARIAGFGLKVEGIGLQELLKDDVVTEAFEDEWIERIENLDEVYMDIVLDYVDTLGSQPDQFIKIT